MYFISYICATRLLLFALGLDANGNAVDGRGFVPANATVVFGNSDAFFSNGSTTDITLNADNLFMGVREKMSVLGSLNASGATARLGDITTIGNMSVNYGAVTVLLREAGDIFDPTTGVVTQDSGVDYVAGGTIDFGQIVALLGTGDNPEFSLPGGDASVQSSAGAFLFKSLDTAVSDLIVSGTTILDVRADGPTNTNVAEALAGAVPQEQQAEPVVADVALSQVALDALVDLGIVIKQPSENLYLIDLPDDLAGSSDTARVSRRRLEPTLVTTLVSDYDEALKETAPVETAQGESGEADPATVSVIRRDAEIKATLDEAWEAFTSEVGEDGTASDAGTWQLSEDPDDKRDGLWIWGLFEEPLYPFLLVSLDSETIGLPEGGRLALRLGHKSRPNEGEQLLSSGSVAARRKENYNADLFGLSSAALDEDTNIGTVSIQPVR